MTCRQDSMMILIMMMNTDNEPHKSKTTITVTTSMATMAHRGNRSSISFLIRRRLFLLRFLALVAVLVGRRRKRLVVVHALLTSEHNHIENKNYLMTRPSPCFQSSCVRTSNQRSSLLVQSWNTQTQSKSKRPPRQKIRKVLSLFLATPDHENRAHDPDDVDQDLKLVRSHAIGDQQQDEGCNNDYYDDDEIVTKITVGRILNFAIPAIGIWLSSPLLSVIDTSAVGLLSGTVQQAALNPAVAVTDYSGRCMSFLYTATTNLIAVSYDKDHGRDKSSSSFSRNTLVGALRVSLRVGICMCGFLLVFGNLMLRNLIGTSTSIGEAQEVLLAARKYVWIRALGMPAAAMIGTAQAACLGMRDTKSPLWTTLLAALVNLVADIFLVRQDHPWIGGVAGAAWATILSQYVAVTFYLQWLVNGNGLLPGKKLGLTFQNRFLINQSSSTTSQQSNTNMSTTTQPSEQRRQGETVRGILRNRMTTRDLFVRRKDEPSTAKDFAPYVVPVTTTQVGRCSIYAAIGIVVSGMNVVNMAANQILTAFLYALIPIADSLSQTAQALLPPILSKDPSSPEHHDHLRLALKSFLQTAIGCGIGLAVFVATIPLLAKWTMTTDPAVQSIVSSAVPIHVLISLFHGVLYASEGILLAYKDLGFLGKMYGIYFAVVPALILQLQRYGSQLRLETVWYAFAAYQFFRISVWVGRVWHLYRKR